MHAQESLRSLEVIRGRIIIWSGHCQDVRNVPELWRDVGIAACKRGKLDDRSVGIGTQCGLETVAQFISDFCRVCKFDMVTDEVIQPIAHRLISNLTTPNAANERS